MRAQKSIIAAAELREVFAGGTDKRDRSMAEINEMLGGDVSPMTIVAPYEMAWLFAQDRPPVGANGKLLPSARAVKHVLSALEVAQNNQQGSRTLITPRASNPDPGKDFTSRRNSCAR